MNKLAIVIPYYKISFFEETLKSVFAQTDKRFTLYIGNDASPDNPKSLIIKYFPAGNYNYYDYSENIGSKNLAMQWKRILDNVTEEWFQILGDDDMISENFVETFYENLDTVINDGSSVIRSPHIHINKNGTIIKDFTFQDRNSNAATFFQNITQRRISASLSENIFKYAEYLKVGFRNIPLAWGTDYLAIYEFSKKRPIFFLQNSLVSVRVTDLSISGRNDNEKEKRSAKIKFYEIILKDHLQDLDIKFILDLVTGYLKEMRASKKLVSANIVTKFIFRPRTLIKIITNNFVVFVKNITAYKNSKKFGQL